MIKIDEAGTFSVGANMMTDEAEDTTRTGAEAKMMAIDEAGNSGTGAKMMETDEAGTSGVGATTSKRPLNRDFEVFLNFRGPDTRYTVVNVLYEALVHAGIRVFYDDDDEGIRKGEVIEGELMDAITNSKIYIPIFSKNYASSSWCLRELSKIMELWKASENKEESKTVLPIFYDVDVSKDVKLRSELYTTTLKKHKENVREDVVESWENALQTAATIKGWNVNEHGLVKLSKLIVERVCRKLLLQSDPEEVRNKYVGIDGPMDDIMRKLDLHVPDVRFVVIYGSGGVGKTTLAKCVFRRITSYFGQLSAFLPDVSKNYHTVGIKNLQKVLISRLLHLNVPDLVDTDEGVTWTREKLKDKKVLILLDDVDNTAQLSKLAGEASWFAKGSRIIITTKNIGIPWFRGEGIYQYKMQEMESDDALKLFNKLAFRGDSHHEENDDEILREAVKTTGGNPKAIVTIAPLFQSDNKDKWSGILEKLKTEVPEDVKETIMISYDQLHKREKEMFLDIACLFINKETEDASHYWKAEVCDPEYEIWVLINFSLIEMVDGNKLGMNGLVRNLGRNIVDDEEIMFPQRRSRLWSPKVAIEVVSQKKGTGRVVALNLGKVDGQHNFIRKQFERFKNLKFLELNGGKFNKEDFRNVFSNLRWLSWENCPSKLRAINFCFRKLLVLMLSDTQITDEWGGWDEIEEANDLKVLKCTRCRFLTKSPNFSRFRKLERLVFSNCPLREIHKSLGKLKQLTYLEIADLSCMKRPYDCIELKKEEPQILPDSIGNLKSLSVLKLELANLFELPDSIGDLRNLKYLYLWCRKLRKLPASVGKLELLVELDISFTAITNLPKSVTNLKNLQVFKCTDCNLKEVPDKIKRLILPDKLKYD